MKFIEIKGDSMDPTLKPGQIVVAKNFRTSKLRQNQIIVYEFMGKIMIKRVVGLPGSNLRIQDTNILEEDTIVFQYPDNHSNKIQYYEHLVPERNVFVIGDNPNNSLDSRKVGTIPLNQVKYYVVARIWPPKLL